MDLKPQDQNLPPIQEQLSYPAPHRPDPKPGDLVPNQLALANTDIEVMGEWPWPHFPRAAHRNYIKSLDGKFQRLPGHETERFSGWEGDFLQALRNSGILRSACLSADVSTRLIQTRRQNDPDFALAYKEAQIQASDLLEAEARRRAMQGVTRSKYQLVKDKSGQSVPVKVEEYIEYSDRLLIELMRANNPEKFRPVGNEVHSQASLQDYARQVARSRGYTAEQEEALVSEALRVYNGSR